MEKMQTQQQFAGVEGYKLKVETDCRVMRELLSVATQVYSTHREAALSTLRVYIHILHNAGIYSLLQLC